MARSRAAGRRLRLLRNPGVAESPSRKARPDRAKPAQPPFVVEGILPAPPRHRGRHLEIRPQVAPSHRNPERPTIGQRQPRQPNPARDAVSGQGGRVAASQQDFPRPEVHRPQGQRIPVHHHPHRIRRLPPPPRIGQLHELPLRIGHSGRIGRDFGEDDLRPRRWDRESEEGGEEGRRSRDVAIEWRVVMGCGSRRGRAARSAFVFACPGIYAPPGPPSVKAITCEMATRRETTSRHLPLLPPSHP